jgi:hypothetical protein
MTEPSLHPVSERVLASLTEDEETGAAGFRPGLDGLAETLAALDTLEAGRVVHELADLVLRLLDDPNFRPLGDELGARLNTPRLIAAYQTFLTGVFAEERRTQVASAQAFGRFRGGDAPTSSVRSVPRSELLRRLPVRG